MNKKTVIAVIIMIIIMTVGMILVYNKIAGKSEITVWDCDISKLQWEIENFPCERNVGPVPDAETAVARAKELWMDKYGVVNGKPYDPTHGCPISVGYDAKNDCWAVNGTLPKNAIGSVPFAIIQSDGTVLAVGMA